MIPAVANLALAKGTAYDVALVIQDAAAQPIDLTGCTLAASIMSASSPVKLAVTVTDAAAGLATVHIPPQTLGMMDWELWIQATPDTPRERILRGLVTVADRVDPRDEGNPSSHRLIVRISDAVTVSIDSVDLAWWAYEQTRKLLGVDYSSLCADSAQAAARAESAAHTSSVNAAASATEAMCHKDAAGLSAQAAASSERNAGTSAQAASSSAREASDAQGAAAQDAQELRRRLDGFALTPGTVEALPYGSSPSVSIDPGPMSGSHVLNFVLVTGPKGDKGDPGTLAANAGDLDLGGHLTATGGTFSATVNANGGINAVSMLAPGLTKTGLNAGSSAVMSVLGNVYHLDHLNGALTILDGSNIKMERALAGWCGLSWAGTLTAHKCALVKTAVTNTNYGGAVSPTGASNYALVMSLLSGVNLAATQTKFGWTGYSGSVTATRVEDIPGPLFYVDAGSRKVVARSGDGQVVTELSWAALSLDWVSRLDLIAVPASSGTCSIYLARHAGVSSGHGNHYNFNRSHLNPQVYCLGEVSLGLVSNGVHYAIIDTCSAEMALFRVSVIQGINPAEYLNVETIS